MRRKSPSATEAVDEEHTFEEDTKLQAVKFEEIIMNSKQSNEKKWQLEIDNLVFLFIKRMRYKIEKNSFVNFASIQRKTRTQLY